MGAAGSRPQAALEWKVWRRGLWGCHLRNTAEDLGVRAVAGEARFTAVSSGGRAAGKKERDGSDTRARASREGRAAGKGLTRGDHWAAAHVHARASGSGCRPSAAVERGRAVCWAGRGELGYGPDGKMVLGRVSGTATGKRGGRAGLDWFPGPGFLPFLFFLFSNSTQTKTI